MSEAQGSISRRGAGGRKSYYVHVSRCRASAPDATKPDSRLGL